MTTTQLETKKSVLVLEDDPQWQRIVSHVLRNVDRDIQIRCVPTTQQALELLAVGEHFDLVVADQYLDGAMTGLDFYRHLRGNQDQTSFVMLSGLASSEFRDLTVQDLELPKFVPKSKAFKTLSEVLRNEISTVESASEKAPAHRLESALLLMIAVSALMFALPTMMVAPKAPAVSNASSNHFNATKAPILMHKRQPANVIIAPRKQHDFVGSSLRAEVSRIVKRAEAIDETVSRQ